MAQKLPPEIRAEIEKSNDYMVNANRSHQDAVDKGNRDDRDMTQMNKLDQSSSNRSPDK